jgi:cysteine-rich repeat protein
MSVSGHCRGWTRIIVLCVAAALAACSDNAGTSRPDAGQRAENCNMPGDEDGNGLADCKDPACATAPACRPICGNGRLDPGEQCDDGNTVNGDGCEASCTLPACGNHILDPGEQCDDGNSSDGDGCDANCTFPACGNHILDPGEQCDDGNTTDADGCEANCTLPACGNHILDPGEQCDDGNGVAPRDSTTCDVDCTFAVCGDGSAPDRSRALRRRAGRPARRARTLSELATIRGRSMMLGDAWRAWRRWNLANFLAWSVVERQHRGRRPPPPHRNFRYLDSQ